MPDVIALFGPTAVGKTAVAIAIAGIIRARGGHACVIGADALQLYNGLPVLTAAPRNAEQAALDHRLVGIIPVDVPFSVAEYAPRAHAEIDGALRKGVTPLVVGGTGLYLRAALTELELRPPPEPGVREALLAEADVHGVALLHTRLAALAPDTAAEIAPTDRTRVVRALELHAQGALRPPRTENELWTETTRHPTRLIGLTMDRPALVAKIEERIGHMVADGVVDEVRAADAAGASPTARAAVGFAEFLAGDPEAAAMRTRRLARRQMTWMRKLANVELIDVTDRSADDVAAEIDARQPVHSPPQ